MADVKGSPGGEGVLQNFFNSLLNRKSGAGLPPSPGGVGSPRNLADNKSRNEVAAELDRLASPNQTLKKPLELSTTPPSQSD